MRLLVLGGTAWLGRHVADAAQKQGHAVTCLARGIAGPAPNSVSFVNADRDRRDAYDRLAGDDWDAIVDVSRQPGQVRNAAAAFAGRCGCYVFVSSVSVYAENGIPGGDESASLVPALESDVMESMQTYGEAKVACERKVIDAFGREASFIVRAGLIGGPGDMSDRTGYWPLRFARPAAANGSVLVPDVPELATQVIDVRDLATWIVQGAGTHLGGIFNATGLAIALPQHLQAARRVAGHNGQIVPVRQEWLLSHGVKPWMGPRSLPLWVPVPEYAGFGSRDSSAARAAGLVTRPLEETLADTLAWELSRNEPQTRQAGLTVDEERSLLAESTATRA